MRISIRSRIALVTIATLLFGVSALPAKAAPLPVTNVGAYFKVELGYMVSWSIPSNTVGITGYTVTASNGTKCVVKSATTNQCTYSTNVVPFGFKPFIPYTFTVVSNSATGDSPVSALSNAATWSSAPGYPAPVLTKVVNSTEIDVDWIPSSSFGGLPNYGYRVTYWEAQLNGYGDPLNSSRVDVITPKTSIALTGLKPSTWYIFSVAQCNALGCSVSDWNYTATTPLTGAALAWRPPMMVNGGNASTACFDAVLNGGTAATTGTISKSAAKCPGLVINPAAYPVIDPSATEEVLPNLVNKFTQNISLGGWQSKYSLATWGKLAMGWIPYLSLTSKSYMRGFIISPTVQSSTPEICQIVGTTISMLKVGTCTLTASAPGNQIWLPTKVATGSFQIIP